MKIPIIDDLLNKVTMYRLTLYYLIFLVSAAFIFSFFDLVAFSPLEIIIGAFVLVCFSYIFNFIFAKMFKAVTNIESVFITSLILLLIIPLNFPDNIPFFILASGVAMGIKYLPTVQKRHVFNPAAGAVAAIALVSIKYSAIWWVATPIMLPFVLIGGLLLVRRIQRELMVFIFISISLILIAISSVFYAGGLNEFIPNMQRSILSSSIFFLAFVMLTEPITSPSTKKLQGIYSVLVAVLYSTPQLSLFNLYLTPEQALSIGNIFSFIVSPKYRLVLKLKDKVIVAKDTMVFNFSYPEKFAFVPGQYMEWTLPHKNTDSRGNRRYFSISSAPKEDLQIAVRFHDKSSSYKSSLVNMKPGDEIIATSLAGDFVIPKKITKPLVFIAGGIGIAPFKSMISYIIEKNLKVDLIVIYSNRTIEEIVFYDLFGKAQAHGVKTIYTLTDASKVPPNWQGETGYCTPELIRKNIPDFKSRNFYISGPSSMVQDTQHSLLELGVSRKNIITDYFPGY